MTADVIVNLYGGIGNQLFQYAAGLTALDESEGSSTSYLLYEGHSLPGSPLLDRLVSLEVASPARLDRARWTEFAESPGLLRPLFRRTARFYESHTQRILIKPLSPFAAAPQFVHGAAYKLEGFFQHPTWFGGSYTRVVERILEHAPEGFEELRQEKRSTIHLRRTDYVPAGWDLPPQAYEDLFNRLPRGLDLVVTTDDARFTPWFASVAKPFGHRLVSPRWLISDPALNDFWNLAAGSPLVISNSTFGWWAAAVANYCDASTEVWYPDPWFTPPRAEYGVPSFALSEWIPFQSHFARQ